MLRATSTTRRRGFGYNGRVMHFPYRRNRAWYAMPKNPHNRTPLANKNPEEYSETWNQRTGIEWYYKLRRRNEYRHWPWVTWQDDPLRRHADESCSRAFSVRNTVSCGRPLWNLYEAVGQDYRLVNSSPVVALGAAMKLHTARFAPPKAIDSFLEQIQERWPTIEDVHQRWNEVEEWNRRTHSVPVGFLDHLRYLTSDVVLLNKKKAYRLEQHEKGILRTNEMVRYFALPYLRDGPAMPVVLEQPEGVFPRGLYTEMNGGTRIHPLFRIDGKHRHGMYPE